MTSISEAGPSASVVGPNVVGPNVVGPNVVGPAKSKSLHHLKKRQRTARLNKKPVNLRLKTMKKWHKAKVAPKSVEGGSAEEIEKIKKSFSDTPTMSREEFDKLISDTYGKPKEEIEKDELAQLESIFANKSSAAPSETKVPDAAANDPPSTDPQAPKVVGTEYTIEILEQKGNVLHTIEANLGDKMDQLFMNNNLAEFIPKMLVKQSSEDILKGENAGLKGNVDRIKNINKANIALAVSKLKNQNIQIESLKKSVYDLLTTNTTLNDNLGVAKQNIAELESSHAKLQAELANPALSLDALKALAEKTKNDEEALVTTVTGLSTEGLTPVEVTGIGALKGVAVKLEKDQVSIDGVIYDVGNADNMGNADESNYMEVFPEKKDADEGADLAGADVAGPTVAGPTVAGSPLEDTDVAPIVARRDFSSSGGASKDYVITCNDIPVNLSAFTPTSTLEDFIKDLKKKKIIDKDTKKITLQIRSQNYWLLYRLLYGDLYYLIDVEHIPALVGKLIDVDKDGKTQISGNKFDEEKYKQEIDDEIQRLDTLDDEEERRFKERNENAIENVRNSNEMSEEAKNKFFKDVYNNDRERREIIIKRKEKRKKEMIEERDRMLNQIIEKDGVQLLPNELRDLYTVTTPDALTDEIDLVPAEEGPAPAEEEESEGGANKAVNNPKTEEESEGKQRNIYLGNIIDALRSVKLKDPSEDQIFDARKKIYNELIKTKTESGKVFVIAKGAKESKSPIVSKLQYKNILQKINWIFQRMNPQDYVTSKTVNYLTKFTINMWKSTVKPSATDEAEFIKRKKALNELTHAYRANREPLIPSAGNPKIDTFYKIGQNLYGTWSPNNNIKEHVIKLERKLATKKKEYQKKIFDDYTLLRGESFSKMLLSERGNKDKNAFSKFLDMKLDGTFSSGGFDTLSEVLAYTTQKIAPLAEKFSGIVSGAMDAKTAEEKAALDKATAKEKQDKTYIENAVKDAIANVYGDAAKKIKEKAEYIQSLTEGDKKVELSKFQQMKKKNLNLKGGGEYSTMYKTNTDLITKYLTIFADPAKLQYIDEQDTPQTLDMKTLKTIILAKETDAEKKKKIEEAFDPSEATIPAAPTPLIPPANATDFQKFLTDISKTVISDPDVIKKKKELEVANKKIMDIDTKPAAPLQGGPPQPQLQPPKTNVDDQNQGNGEPIVQALNKEESGVQNELESGDNQAGLKSGEQNVVESDDSQAGLKSGEQNVVESVDSQTDLENKDVPSDDSQAGLENKDDQSAGRKFLDATFDIANPETLKLNEAEVNKTDPETDPNQAMNDSIEELDQISDAIAAVQKEIETATTTIANEKETLKNKKNEFETNTNDAKQKAALEAEKKKLDEEIKNKKDPVIAPNVESEKLIQLKKDLVDLQTQRTTAITNAAAAATAAAAANPKQAPPAQPNVAEDFDKKISAKQDEIKAEQTAALQTQNLTETAKSAQGKTVEENKKRLIEIQAQLDAMAVKPDDTKKPDETASNKTITDQEAIITAAKKKIETLEQLKTQITELQSDTVKTALAESIQVAGINLKDKAGAFFSSVQKIVNSVAPSALAAAAKKAKAAKDAADKAARDKARADKAAAATKDKAGMSDSALKAQMAKMQAEIDALKDQKESKEIGENEASIQAIMTGDDAVSHKIKFLVDIPKWQEFKVIQDTGTSFESNINGLGLDALKSTLEAAEKKINEYYQTIKAQYEGFKNETGIKGQMDWLGKLQISENDLMKAEIEKKIELAKAQKDSPELKILTDSIEKRKYRLDLIASNIKTLGKKLGEQAVSGATPDANKADANKADANKPAANKPDATDSAGPKDAGPKDAGPKDAGPKDAGPNAPKPDDKNKQPETAATTDDKNKQPETADTATTDTANAPATTDKATTAPATGQGGGTRKRFNISNKRTRRHRGGGGPCVNGTNLAADGTPCDNPPAIGASENEQNLALDAEMDDRLKAGLNPNDVPPVPMPLPEVVPPPKPEVVPTPKPEVVPPVPAGPNTPAGQTPATEGQTPTPAVTDTAVVPTPTPAVTDTAVVPTPTPAVTDTAVVPTPTPAVTDTAVTDTAVTDTAVTDTTVTDTTATGQGGGGSKKKKHSKRHSKRHSKKRKHRTKKYKLRKI